MSRVKILREHGLALDVGGVKFVFDSKPIDNSIQLISHAHLDHVDTLSQMNVIMTNETSSILKSIGRRGNWTTIDYGIGLIILDDLKIFAESSGHVLGSAQFIIDTDGLRLVYTGDLNIYDSLVHEGAKPVDSDILIIESTYGEPSYRFPSREKIYANIVKWILKTVNSGQIPAFKVYSLGKSQEIIQLINAYLDIPVVVSQSVARISEKYREYGKPLEYLSINSIEGLEVLRHGECVYVSSFRDELPSRKKTRWAVATGWAIRYRYSSYDMAFPLSGHSDYDGLIKYVEESSPKQVYTIHGFAKEFSRHLVRRGIRASPL
ncbi:MAG: MBL fold metallo-hydrolase [Nitrososphaerota archaeon]|nr:MBL fold metallo-hydrolase [Nitrososphaerota archaeon]